MSIKAWLNDDDKLVWNGPIRQLEPGPLHTPSWYRRHVPSRWELLRMRLHDARIWLKKTFRPRTFWRDLSRQLERQEQIIAMLDIIETRNVL